MPGGGGGAGRLTRGRRVARRDSGAAPRISPARPPRRSSGLWFLGGLGRRLLLVRGIKVEIDAAQGALVVGLAEDDGDLLVERNAMTKVRPAVFVGADGLLHQRAERGVAFFGGLVEADDEFLGRLHGIRDFLF